MAELSHFLFNSDYSTDKIAFTQTGTHTYASPSGTKYIYINTGINTQLYAEGDYKFSGSDRSYNMSDTYNSDASLITFMYDGVCWIGIRLQYYEEDYGKTMNYRIWAYYNEQEAKNTDMSETANISKRVLIFNSDENYPRFISDGYLSNGDSNYYRHNLGYIPFVKAWQRYNNMSIPRPNGSGNITVDYYSQQSIGFFGNANNSDYAANVIHVTTLDIWAHITQFPGDPVGFYYRIYHI